MSFNLSNLPCTSLKYLMTDVASSKFLIRSINKQLSDAGTRLQGLEALNSVLECCSDEILNENFTLWLNYSCPQPRDDLKDLKLRLIGNLVKRGRGIQEFSKKFVLDYIAKVVEICLSSHKDFNEVNGALKTLTICMKYYGSWFNTHRQKIETFLLSFLDNDVEHVTKNAAEAFHYLQQTGSAGIEDVNHKRNFSSNFHKLCVTVHGLFDEFFINEMEVEKFIFNDDKFIFVEIPLDTFKMLDLQSNRIKNSLLFIQTMILKGFPVAKSIKPIEILNLIERGLNIHHCFNINSDSSHEYQYAFHLINIQISLLNLMRALIIWMDISSLPLSHVINKVLVNTLELCKRCSCFSKTKFKQAIYKCLTNWFGIIKSGFNEHFQLKLINCILDDVLLAKSELSLTVLENAKGKSSESKRKAMQNRIISSNINNKVSSKSLEDDKNKNRYFALETLQQLLYHSVLKLNDNKLKELYMTIIELLTSDVTCPDSLSKLYEILITFYQQRDVNIILPPQIALKLLAEGSKNANQKVSKTCDKGLQILEKLCQPILPSLNILWEVNQEENITNDAAEESNVDISLVITSSETTTNNENFTNETIDESEVQVTHIPVLNLDSSSQSSNMNTSDLTSSNVKLNKCEITQESEMESIEFNVIDDSESEEESKKDEPDLVDDTQSNSEEIAEKESKKSDENNKKNTEENDEPPKKIAKQEESQNEDETQEDLLNSFVDEINE